MECRLLNVPPAVHAGTTITVSIVVDNGTPGASCEARLFLTAPDPDLPLGTQRADLDASGSAVFFFDVTLGRKGQNVLHVETETATQWDSDSKGLLVI